MWERESSARVLEISKITGIEDTVPMNPLDFQAMINASRWNALSPFISPFDINKASDFYAASPFFGAIKTEDYQMFPLAQALSMERISLLLADDVGLGKTIEAGLILTELLLRRKIRRVLILTPASLKQQWHQEMRERFNLGFDFIDRDSTLKLRQNQGLEANPWRILPKVISSYYYLRQPDILEQFLSTCRREARTGEDTAKLPWDLLIVDEAHNCMPAPFGESSELTKMLHEISPYFEHKIFLTATPHNGHTRSFTGLLELLDPVRFVQKAELTDGEKRLVKQVVIRRLKSDINEVDRQRDVPPRFVERYIQPTPVYFSKGETLLYQAFQAFKEKVKKAIRSQATQKNLAGSFAIEVLSKRLLSCPLAFADSWERIIQTITSDAESIDERALNRTQRIVAEELEDDGEKESRIGYASTNIGAWLKPYVGQITEEIELINKCLQGLRIYNSSNSLNRDKPPMDSRVSQLIELIKREIRDGESWKDDERLIIFTEYKTTLDYIYGQLKSKYNDFNNSIALLYGGSDASMNDTMREGIKQRFNDPNDPVRILVATDTASEGLNLQTTAHRLFHFDIPWNPSRLEQRNGRLDRHGQARNVIVYHFTNDENLDLQFLSRVVEKTEHIREDLGSVGELFDRAFKRKLLEEENIDDVFSDLDFGIQQQQERRALTDEIMNNSAVLRDSSESFKQSIRINPDNLKNVFSRALTNQSTKKDDLLVEDLQKDVFKIKMPVPVTWRSTFDDTLRLHHNKAMPSITFNPHTCQKMVGGRSLFNIPDHIRLLHLGHPVLKESLAFWSRQRYRVWVEKPGNAGPWTYGYSSLPNNVDAVILFHVEELGINELRETFHHWVRTWQIPLVGESLGDPILVKDPLNVEYRDEKNKATGKVLELLEDELPSIFQDIQKKVINQMPSLLNEAREKAVLRNRENYSKRLQEISLSMRNQSIEKLEKELNNIISSEAQSLLFTELQKDEVEKKRRVEEEIQLRTERYKELKSLLESERDRIIDQIIPRKYKLSGDMKFFPLGIEIVLPGGEA